MTGSDDLRFSNPMLRSRIEELEARVAVAEERERARLSRVLHDDLQQLLFGIRMKLDMIGEDLADAQAPLVGELGKAREWVERAIAVTRRLTMDLSTPSLEHGGFVPALRWLARRVEELHGLSVKVEIDDALALDDRERAMLLFQSVRELLFNVAKHAGIDRATVRIELRDGMAHAEVSDRGTGFDTHVLEPGREPPAGWGLATLRHRVGSIGGALDVESAPGDGTRATVKVPLPPLGSGA